ncbi:MAG: outer membrane beta-barrel protein [Bacteroidales bacterium]|nr:outer membrane beta-barrel protein [Bacteroidales bacterium]
MKKNYQIVSKLLALTLIVIIPGVMFAQNANREDGSDRLYYQWYLNLNGGITQSYCDIQGGDWHGAMLGSDDMEFGYGIRLGKHVSPVFGIYGSFIKAPLSGKSGVDSKNMYFETDLSDMILGTTVSFSNLFFGYKPRLLNFYGTTGIGFVNFDANAYDIDTDLPVDDGINGGDGYPSTTETMIPTGAGLDIRFNNRWDVNLETTIRWFDSDKLDGIQSGEKRDAYFFTSLGVGYSFWRPTGGAKMQIETEPSMLALHGDSIPIEIKGSFPDSYNKRAIVDFTPVLKYGDKTKQLETLYFQGGEVAEEFKKPGAIVIPETGGSFTYKTYVKYEPGMDVCELYVEPMSSIKGRTPSTMGDRKIADGLIMTSKRISNVENVLLAGHGYVPDIVVTEMGTIYYVVNRHNLNLNYKLNKMDDAKQNLSDMNDFIGKGWEIKSINISAWASPEGEESFNQGLSQRRSETAEKYSQNIYDKYVKAVAKELGVSVDEIKQDVKFSLSANGEDWDGFMQALQASDIQDKNIIANVVNSQSDPAKKEQEIRNMTVIYSEIEDDILPPLRRAVINVNCYEPSYSDGEIAEYATSAPDSLNAQELLYAATLTDDPQAQLNIFKTVIDKYPNDWRGYNNAGNACVALEDFDAAKQYFTKAYSLAEDNGIVLNNNGAIASKEKDFTKAKENYMAAQKQGVDVNYNMGIVKIAQGNYNGAINSLGSTKCDYNLALAHTLSGNYNAATSTLNCAEKTPDTYYLLAVIGARTNNDNMVFKNLKSTVAADASYISTIKDDMEFAKYYTNPQFIEIIK